MRRDTHIRGSGETCHRRRGWIKGPNLKPSGRADTPSVRRTVFAYTTHVVIASKSARIESKVALVTCAGRGLEVTLAVGGRWGRVGHGNSADAEEPLGDI